MKTIREVEAWCDGAAEQFGDPSIPVCQLFARFLAGGKRGDDIAFTFDPSDDRDLALWLPQLPFPVALSLAPDHRPLIDPAGQLIAFGWEQIVPGIVALTPSLNLPLVIHAFVVLYDVPNPVPWEKSQIVLAS
jgi:hypothetical protein